MILNRNPQLSPNFDTLLLPGKGVVLLRENSTHVLYGNLYVSLIPLLDGSYSTDEIIGRLESNYKRFNIYLALIILQSKGYICEAITNLNTEEAAFWAELELDPEQANRLVSQACVEVISLGRVDGTSMKETLLSNNIRVVDAREESTIAIVICDDYLNDNLIKLNQQFHQQGRRWLLMRPRGRELWLGPIFNDNQPGCHACLERWLRRQRSVEQYVSLQKRTPLSELIPKAISESSKGILNHLASLEVKKILANASQVCNGHLLSFDCADYKSTRHKLIVNPQCKVCGKKNSQSFEAVKLVTCPVAFDKDGGHRQIAPEETLKRFKQFISPITGVVSELRELENELESVHVYVAGHNFAQSKESFDDLRRNLRSNCVGKGSSAVQARTSALCEALERFSGERHGDELVEIGSLHTMQKRYDDAVIHPNDVMLFSDKQFKERDYWNFRGSRFNKVPEPLDPDLETEWTPVWSLSHSCRRFLPTQLLYVGQSPHDNISKNNTSLQRPIAVGCSNGCASGNTLEEAVIQGIFELVERDSVAIWWYNRLQYRGVDLASCQDNWINNLINDYKSIGRELWALDITNDLDIPCIVALSRVINSNTEQILMGLGCHLDPRIAIQRALAEMNQMLSIANSFSGRESNCIDDLETLSWLETATTRNQPYLNPDMTQTLRRLEDFSKQYSGDLMVDITHCRTCLENLGLEVLILDQTRPLIGVPTVKVVVPGLRHFWARYASGRIFDVPVKLGWLDKPLKEEDLNQIPIFF